MKLFFSLVLVAMLSVPKAFAASETYADERILVGTTTAVGFSAAKIAQPSNSASPCGALVSAEGQNVRFYLSGSLPTPTSGHVLTAGNSIAIDSWADLRNFKAIGDVSNSTITVSFFRGCSGN